jgi:hypothetical protein
VRSEESVIKLSALSSERFAYASLGELAPVAICSPRTLGVLLLFSCEASLTASFMWGGRKRGGGDVDGCGDDRGDATGVPSFEDGDALRCPACWLLVCAAVAVFRFLVDAVVKL